MLDKINNLQANNSKEYWTIVNRLKEAKQDNTIDNIDPSEWYQWFKSLNTKENQKNNKEFREKTLSIVEKKHFFAERFVKILDSHITSAEITKACCKLKNNKACGVDSISSEILKSISQTKFNTLLVKLFNKSLKTPSFHAYGKEVT